MRNFTVPLVMALSIASSGVNADALGFFVGGGLWDYDSTGTFGTTGDDVIDVESDLNFSSQQDAYVWAAFEHFVPIIPNIRVEAASMGSDGAATNLNYGGVNVSGPASVNLDTAEAILYYRLLDNWVSLDLGISVRNVDGDFIIASEKVSISETIPMLYGSVQFELPLSGFSVGGDISIINYSGSEYRDVRLRAVYEIGIIGFEAGYKTSTIVLDDVSGVTADLEFSGLMLGAFLHF